MSALPSRFGPYEIIGPLGAGGMGQVYRARDTRLQRTVAIKVLHEAGATDPVRQQRFAREAVAASALNHPNIITVYDVGVEGDTPYLVSELIEGGSLRAEMLQGRLPIKRAIDLVQQIADGLAAAHDAGIVHRDLKPENVMLTSDDRVKIVDFGLAKAESGDEAVLTAQTKTQTAEGLIVGTVPYMSPEQARGGKADFRSDQFAVGVILYELTTGAHPFQRETAVQTLSAIIAEEPPDPAKASPPLPLPLRLLLRRLLAKNPRERFAHTADLAAEIRTTRQLLTDTSSSITPVVPDPRPPRTWPLRVAAALAIGLVGLMAGRAVEPAETRASFERFVPFATDAGYQGSPAWSPDGKTIAYEAEIDGVVQIFTRSIGAPMRTQVTRSAFDCYGPFWSADGRSLYYHSLARESDALWRVSAAGGAPAIVIEGASNAAISPDGRMAMFLRQEPLSTSYTLWTLALPDGVPERYSPLGLADDFFSGGEVRFSPDGTKVLVWIGARNQTGKTGFWEVPIAGGQPREILAAESRPGLVPPTFSWLPDNRYVVLSRSSGPTPGTHLWLADTAGGALTPLTTTALNESAPAVSPDGRAVAFESQATDFDLVEVPLDGSPLRPYLSSTRNEYDPAVSPVSTQFAYVTDRTGDLEIWLQNEEGYLQQPLVKAADVGGSQSLAVGALAFSPNGDRLAFQRADDRDKDSPGGPLIWITSTAGGTPVRLGGPETYQDAPTWSPDGEWIAYLSSSYGNVQLAKVRLGEAGNAVVLAPDIPPFVARPRWSPDGKSILCETAEGLTVFAADGSGARRLADPGWLAYAWDSDSRRILGLRPTDDSHHFMFVALDVSTGAERVIAANLGTIPQALQPIRGFSRLRNGNFLTSIARVRSDIYLMEGLHLPARFWERLWPFTTARR